MQKHFVSMLLLWIGLIGGAGFTLFTQLLLVRTISVEDMGAIAGVTSLMLLAIPAAEFGISGLWLRIFGKEGATGFAWIKPSLRVTILTSVVSLIALLLIGHWAWSNGQQTQLLYWLLPLPFMEALVAMAGARLQLEGRYRILSIWRSLPKFSRLLVVIVAWILGADVISITIGYCLVSLILSIAALMQLIPMMRGLAKLEIHPLSFINHSISPPTHREVIRQAWPFAMGNVFSLIYLQSDIFMLSALSNETSTALYTVAFSLLAFVYLLPTAIFNQFLLPKYHRWAEYDQNRLLQVYRLGNGSMVITGVIVMLGLAWIAPFLVQFLFGAAYTEAGAVVQILAICVPFRYVASSIGNCLVTQDYMRKKVKYQMLVACFNVVLNICLIPEYGMYGAAISTVASEILLCLLYLLGVWKHVFGSDAVRGWTVNYKALSQ